MPSNPSRPASTLSRAALLHGKGEAILELSDIYNEAEVATLIQMMGAGRYSSLRRTVRAALNHYAVHLMIGAKHDVFLD